MHPTQPSRMPGPSRPDDRRVQHERIRQIVENSSDPGLYSHDIRAAIASREDRHYLSETRANVLRPLKELLAGDVLELGAEAGTITHYLAAVSEHVTALEPSETLAAAAAARNREFPNVRVVNAAIGEFRSSAKFDAVTAIGAPLPLQQLASLAREALKPEGTFIYAADNRLALNHFATGFESAALAESVTRAAAVEILREAGFEQAEVLIPLPDFRFAASVVFPLAWRTPGFDSAAFLANSVFADAYRVPSPLFSMESAWIALASSGLEQDLASSFLFVARRAAAPHPLGASNANVLVRHYSSNRRPEFLKEVRVERMPAGLMVQRERMVPEAPADPSYPIRMVAEGERYVSGSLWSDRLAPILNKPGWTIDRIAHWAEPWIALLREAAAGSEFLPGSYLDATPFNLIAAPDGGFHFVDLEWETSEPLELKFVLVRGLYWALRHITTVARPSIDVPVRYSGIVAAVLSRFRLPSDEADHTPYFMAEARFAGLAGGLPIPGYAEGLAAAGLSIRPAPAETAAEIRVLAGSVDAQYNEFLRLRAEVAAAGERFDRLESGWSELAGSVASNHDVFKAIFEHLAVLDSAGSAHGAGIETERQRLDRLESGWSELAGSVASNHDVFGAIFERLAAADSANSTLRLDLDAERERLNRLNSGWDTLASSVASNHELFGALLERLGFLEAREKTAEAAIAAQRDRLDGFRQSIDEQFHAADAKEVAALAGLNEAIAAARANFESFASALASDHEALSNSTAEQAIRMQALAAAAQRTEAAVGQTQAAQRTLMETLTAFMADSVLRFERSAASIDGVRRDMQAKLDAQAAEIAALRDRIRRDALEGSIRRDVVFHRLQAVEGRS